MKPSTGMKKISPNSSRIGSRACGTRGQEKVIERRQQPGCAAVGEQVEGEVLLAAAPEGKLRVSRRLQGKRPEIIQTMAAPSTAAVTTSGRERHQPSHDRSALM
jgi:hypothetical protein